MKYSYIIIDDSAESILKTLSVAARFQNLQFLASANSYSEGLDLILEHHPTFVFLEINPSNKDSNLSLLLINELHRFLKVLPKIIITTNNSASAIEAIQHGAFDYLSKPIDGNALRKSILKFEKTNENSNLFSANPKIASQQQFTQTVNEAPDHNTVNSISIEDISVKHEIVETEDVVETSPGIGLEENAILIESEDAEVPIKKVLSNLETYKEDKPLIICVKSYGDYRFIEAKDICYLQADNNSTDIHLYNGEMITAFKTLKHFENVLSSPFVRIHNSYIVNIDYVSRIHTGNSVCYIKNTTTKLPFSKSYKENVDAIINSITKGNYIEI
ncbi:response regulator transcription factor [Flavobacterium sp.]|uniref:LytR/AlgR family response regulator transcription factor n=1 Tax=Flavobacterium sp. TaxID=239 RepID=UPI00286BA2BC|nr:response regulator transcription factor [Flavobacterium sp.]